MEYLIKKATKNDVKIMIDWAANEGWNPGKYDADSFFAADPGGFLMGYLDNIPVSCISAVSYRNTFGFLGLYIVKKEYRGKGFGIRIWKEALKYLDGQNIGLDGVVSQQENYKKSGFKLAYRNIRYTGQSRKVTFFSSNLMDIIKIPFEKILNFDEKCFPAARNAFLKEFINQKDSFGAAIVEKKNIKGYGLIRKCGNGFKIGPLFAENKKTAELIFINLRNILPVGTPYFFDVPEVNKEAIKLAENTGMKPIFETARMYNKFIPDLPLTKIYGVTTFELG